MKLLKAKFLLQNGLTSTLIKLSNKLEDLEIKQEFRLYEREKPRPSVIKDPGRQPLFTRLEIEKLIKLIDNGLFKI